MKNALTKLKRVLSLVMVFAILLTLVPFTANAAGETITVYFRNDWKWSDVCIHYWGGSTSTNWPGKAMTKIDKQDDYDVYSVEIPRDSTGIIFNGLKDDGSGDRDQTPDIKSNISDGKAFTVYWNNGNQYKTIDYTPPVTKYEVAFDGNVTLEGDTTVEENKGYTATVKAVSEGYELKENGISVTMGGEDAEFTYDAEAGTITVAKVTGNLKITANAVAKVYTVKLEGKNVSSDGADEVTHGEEYSAKLTAAEGYVLPETIQVTMGGNTAEHTYDQASGELAIANVTGDVVITVAVTEAPTEPETKTLYLKADHWKTDGARFAAYFFTENVAGNTWASMTDSDGDSVYEVEIPAGEWKNVIFCRMNGSTTANNWDNKWNQTGDLTIPTDDKNLFTVPDGKWDGVTTAWSVYEKQEEPDPVVHTVTLNLTNLTSTNTAEQVEEGKNYTTKLEAATGFSLPETVTVTVGGNSVTPSYDKTTGDLTVANVTGDLVITAAGVEVTPEPETKTLYLKPNSNWVQGDAWFAAYFFEDSNNTWVKMTDSDSDGVYELEVPEGTWSNVIFCRMNAAKTALGWDSKWDQTQDLTIPADKNLFAVDAGVWNNATGSWSIYTKPVFHTVTLNLTNLTSTNTAEQVEEGKDYTTKLEAATGFSLPETVTVTVGGNSMTPSYDKTTGDLTVANVTGDLVITAAGVEVPTTPETITVYFCNDWNWPEVFVRTFGSATSADTTWPGLKMTKTSDTVTTGNGEKQIWSAEVPADAKLVFNGLNADNPNDRQQTPDVIDVQDGDTYIIFWDGTNNKNGVMKFEGYNPGTVAPVTNVKIHFRNSANWSAVKYHAWIEQGETDADITTWPGLDMTAEDGYPKWYCVTLEDLNAPKGIGILFNKGEGGDGNQTPNIPITKNGEYWYDNGTLTTTAPDTYTAEDTDVEYTATFHFADQKGWNSVNLYSWLPDGTVVTSGWPGDAMGNDGNGFHSLTVTYKAPEDTGLNVIFNGGGTQTVDLALQSSQFQNHKLEKWVELTNEKQVDGKTLWEAAFHDSSDAIAVSPIVNGTSVTFQYKNAAAQSVEVRGTMLGEDGWNTGKAMTKNAHGVWSVTVENVTPGDHQYKFYVDGQWVLDPVNSSVEGDNNIFQVLDPNAKDENTITVKIYYDRADGIYETTVNGEKAQWNAYIWGEGFKSGRYNFEEDSQGRMVTTVTITDGRVAKSLALKTRLSSETNDWIREESEINVDLTDIVSGTIEVFITSDGQNGEAGKVTYTRKYGLDVVKANKITDLQLDYDKNILTLKVLKSLSNPKEELQLIAAEDVQNPVEIEKITSSGNTHTLTLSGKLDLVTLYKYKIEFENHTYAIGIDTVYASDAFAEDFTYDGELGALYTKDETEFRLWAPTAEKVTLNLYASGTKGTDDKIKSVSLEKGAKGLWSVKVDGDQNGTYYTYSVKVDGETVEAIDPYARTAGVNGNRGMVIDMASVKPDDGTLNELSNKPDNQTDAIIYELHVRDFSISDESGVKDAWQGKFLGLTQTGTKTSGGSTTGLDYLKDLGITHLHLLPIYDYASVKEDKLDKAQFNWGYDPQNYNVPEGSYSTNPYKGEVRVQEMKQMVDVLHENNIGVLMDVVYNHVYDADTFSFNQIVPGYFSRVDSNRSGCGNDTASEREMVRKYIVDSVVYWAKAYDIDGFRFDLVGLLDVETINKIVEEVHKFRPDAIFYGEGWDMDDTKREPGTEMAKQGNASKTPGFGYFSDGIRNDLGGNNGHSKGFASGESGKEGAIAAHIQAKPWWTSNPTQVVQYASCHDNYTLADKIILSTGRSSLDGTVIKMNNLAAATYMTAQGVSFIHAGEEILREKLYENGKREENSYNKGDAVNHIQWEDLDDPTYQANAAYYKGLIAFRKAHPALRYTTAEDVATNVQILESSNKIVAYRIDGEGAKGVGETDDILVILNANSTSVSKNLPEGKWTVNARGNQAGTASLGTAEGSISVAGYSAVILTKTNEGKDETAPLGASEAKSIYFSNNKYWDKVYAYAYAGSGEELLGQWPGTLAEKVGTNEHGEDIYEIKLPASETGIAGVVISSGSDEQTVDIVPGYDGTGYYCDGDKNGNKWPVSTYVYRHPAHGTEEDHYLVGWINGNNFMGPDYKLDENGQVTATFNADSYVYVINGTGEKVYMTDGWLGSVTEATLYDTSKGNKTWDKMMIPGGLEVTITVEKNTDGTMTMRYETSAKPVVDASGIQDGLTLHCWNWSFAQIEANMAEIAAQGYTAIQTSPVQPLKETTSESKVGSHWWVYYQPVDFKINTVEGNALGTKSELVSMINTAHDYGVKVIVDVVANHLANETGNNLSPKIPEYLRKDAYWHDITQNTNDWNDRYEVTQYCMSGLPDLNTGNKEIQGYVLDFLKECVDAGVDGFRFDAAKSIETPIDNATFASDFWPTVISGAESYAKQTSGKDLYIYGEVLDSTGGVALIGYTQYMAVTDNTWGNALRNNIAVEKAALKAAYDKSAAASALVLWAESHDTYATDDMGQNSAGVSDEDIIKTWALVAARKDAMGLYFARPESNTQKLGVASVTAWACDAVEEINKFHNAFVDAEEAVSNENGISYIERGNAGVVLVKAVDSASSNISVTAKAMADGTYEDQISGNTFTVADGKITGTIGDSGVAVVYNVTKYAVAVEDSQDGTVNTDVQKAAEGDKVTATVTANEGKLLEQLSVKTASGAEVPVTKNADGSYSFIQPAAAVTVTAVFKTITYTVTWLDDAGKEIDSVTVAHGASLAEDAIPAVPEKEGFTAAWEDVDLSKITKDTTVKAVYTIKTYTVTWLDEAGKEVNSVTVVHGAAVAKDSVPAVPEKEGFTGAWEDVDLSKITKDTTVKAVYTIKTYTVTWLDEAGKEVDSVTVVHGASVAADAIPTVPEKEGYTGAWEETDLSKVTQDITVKPVYTKISDGGDDDNKDDETDKTYDNTVKESISGKVELPEKAPVAGEKVIITVTPDEGIEVVGVVVKDTSGKGIPVTKNSDGTYSFTQPEGDVIVEAQFKAAYRIVKGNGAEVTGNGKESITMTVNGAFHKFQGIRVDGKTVDAEHYTAKAGSTIITLKGSFLKTLSEGEHDITVLYTDGQTQGTFQLSDETEPTEKPEVTEPTEKPEETEPTEKPETTEPTEEPEATEKPGKPETPEKSDVPATGDEANMMLWTGVTFLSIAALAVLMSERKRKAQQAGK